MVPIKSKPLYLQVEEFVREKIISGEYRVNRKIPSTSELVAITGTSVCTVQAALSKLCREGLIDRTVGRSTIVKGSKTTLSCVGLYFSRSLSLTNSGFYQVLAQELRRQLGEQGVQVCIWTDERETAEQDGPVGSLSKAIETREIQALIAPLMSRNDVWWMQKLPIPISVLSTDPLMKSRVGGSSREFVKAAFGEMQRQGCRSLGVITHFYYRPSEPESLEMEFHRTVRECAGELGLEIRDEWVRSPKKYDPHFAQFGHQQFHELWNLPQRPDGVFVFPDLMVSGVITAILERRLDVPHDLKVIFHANDLLPYVCPFPATFLLAEVGRYASALIDLIRCQLEGGEPRTISVPFSVVSDGNPFRRPS